MRKITFSLMLLTLTSSAYAMEKDPFEEIMSSGQQQLEIFPTRSLEEQKNILIEHLKAQYRAKQELRAILYLNLGHVDEPMDFTPETVLEVSGKQTSIKDMETENLLPLLKHCMFKTIDYLCKKNLLNEILATTQLAVTYDKKLVNQRHKLIAKTCLNLVSYNKYNEKLHTNLVRELPQDLIQGSERFVVQNNKNKLNKFKSIKAIYAKVDGLVVKCKKNPFAIENENQNDFCQETCFLKSFTEFSNQDLFALYKASLAKFVAFKNIHSYYSNEPNTCQTVYVPLPQKKNKQVLALKTSITPNEALRIKLEKRNQQQTVEKKQVAEPSPCTWAGCSPTKPKKEKKTRQPNTSRPQKQVKAENTPQVPKKNEPAREKELPRQINKALPLIGSTIDPEDKTRFVRVKNPKDKKISQPVPYTQQQRPVVRTTLQNHVIPSAPIQEFKVSISTQPVNQERSFLDALQNKPVPQPKPVETKVVTPETVTVSLDVLPKDPVPQPEVVTPAPVQKPAPQKIEQKGQANVPKKETAVQPVEATKKEVASSPTEPYAIYDEKEDAFIVKGRVDIQKIFLQNGKKPIHHNDDVGKKLLQNKQNELTRVTESRKALEQQLGQTAEDLGEKSLTTTENLHRQPEEAKNYTCDSVAVKDHPTISNIMIQENFIHIYHDKEGIEQQLLKIQEELRIEKQREMALKQKVEKVQG